MENKEKTSEDMLGYPVKVGDRVLFASGGQQDDGLYMGTVTDIYEKHRTVIEIKKDKGSKNKRGSTDIFSLEHVGENMPELFL